MTTLLAAGPATELALSTLGLVVLTRRRRGRATAQADTLDWLATGMAGLCLRWLTRVPAGVISGLTSGFYTVDEAFLSQHAGLPPWGLPIVLVVPAAFGFRHLVRQHPPGARLVPLAMFYAGQGVGVVLWTNVLAPLMVAA